MGHSAEGQESAGRLFLLPGGGGGREAGWGAGGGDRTGETAVSGSRPRLPNTTSRKAQNFPLFEELH